MTYIRLALIIAVLLCAECTLAQSRLDSLQHIKEIVVEGRKYKEVIPAQTLSGKELESLNSFSVADAIRYFSGVQVKDYGGIGGLKTVNIRSMGTQHVGVFYDGIQLGNAQNGTVDLGKFSLDNLEEISVYNGQKSEIFQPARDFGSSGSVYLRSRTPKFRNGNTYNLKATVKGGSFDLINPSILYETKVNDKVSASFNTELINSSGKYKYRYKRVNTNTGETMYDTTAIRQNGDVFSVRAEGGLYGTVENGFWKTKAYFYNSNRGIPGAIVNNVWKHAQRQRDKNFFVQGSFQKAFSDKYEFQANAKYADDWMNYVNPDTTLMLIDNTFKQQDVYVSVANKYSILDNWDVALSADVQHNTLRSDMAGFVYPKRTTVLVAAATAAELGRVKMQASVLATIVRERINSDNSAQNDTVAAAPNKQEFTPAVFVSYKPFNSENFSLRAFYKNIFRMPTFNDLYYTDIGNIALKPEYTHQYNLGFHYNKNYNSGFVARFQLQADAYYNEVTNKIIAVPKGSGQYRWMMMNLGKVEIRGVDVSSTSMYRLGKDMMLNLKLSYTYQKAQDFTERKSDEMQDVTYGGQIAYIPWHSGSVIAGLAYKQWNLNYSFIYVGERYHNSANIPANYEQPWYTHDMSVLRNFKIGNTNMRVAAEINNLLSQDYEVVLNYPMPKRNYKLIITIEI